MLLRRVAADDGSGSGAGVGRPPRLFAVPRLLVGVGTTPRCGGGGAADCDGSPTAARSPKSPLDDLRTPAPPFAALGGGSSLLRSPRSPRTSRSWDAHRLGLGGLVDDDLAALAEPAAAGGATKRPLGLGPQAWRQAFNFKLLPQRLATQPRDCAHASSALGNAGTAAAAAAGNKTVPCSRSYGDVKSGPEVAVPGAAAAPRGASIRPAHLGALFPAPGSLPASIGGGPRRYVGSVSATEVEQSEDYTCIIAHGPNPKTTRIFGDCILEPCTLGDGGMDDAMEVKEGAESYWLVKCFDGGEPGQELMSSCVSCKKKLDRNGSCICRGEKAFCSTSCKDQEVVTEEEEENITAVSSLSSAGSSSSFGDDIFMAEMVLAAPVDVHYP